MEEKSEVKEEKETEEKRNGDFLLFQNPCNYFQEFIRLLLNCLGFTSSNGQAQPDPPSDPPADPQAAELSRVTPPRAPPRPPISGGGGPQTNANPN